MTRHLPLIRRALERIACTMAVVALGCAHHARDPDDDVAGPPTHRSPPLEVVHIPPDDDVGAALTPCPRGFPGISVRDVLAKTRPLRSCLAIVGHLSAAEGGICNMRPASDRSDQATMMSPATTPKEIRRCAPGWVLTDLSDPTVVREDESSPPFIRVRGTTPSMRWVRTLLGCNRDGSGQPIMPPRTRLGLPSILRVNDIPRLNASLAGLTVGIFGGKSVPDDMADVPDTFDSMVVTHICRIEAPAGSQ